MDTLKYVRTIPRKKICTMRLRNYRARKSKHDKRRADKSAQFPFLKNFQKTYPLLFRTCTRALVRILQRIIHFYWCGFAVIYRPPIAAVAVFPTAYVFSGLSAAK